MTRITEEELSKLLEFETMSLIRAIDDLDTMRSYLNDRGHYQPPKLREDLMELHELAMDVVNHGASDRGGQMFDLAFEIEDQLFDLAEALDRLQESLHSLTDRCPEGLSDDDVSERE